MSVISSLPEVFDLHIQTQFSQTSYMQDLIIPVLQMRDFRHSMLINLTKVSG